MKKFIYLLLLVCGSMVAQTYNPPYGKDFQNTTVLGGMDFEKGLRMPDSIAQFTPVKKRIRYDLSSGRIQTYNGSSWDTYSFLSDLSNYVTNSALTDSLEQRIPYTGGNQNVNLGNHTLIAGHTNGLSDTFNNLAGPLFLNRWTAGLGGAGIIGNRAGGTFESPATVTNNMPGGGVETNFYNGTSWVNASSYRQVATETHNSTSAGSAHLFGGMKNGTNVFHFLAGMYGDGSLRLYNRAANDISISFTTPGLLATLPGDLLQGMSFHDATGGFKGSFHFDNATNRMYFNNVLGTTGVEYVTNPGSYNAGTLVPYSYTESTYTKTINGIAPTNGNYDLFTGPNAGTLLYNEVTTTIGAEWTNTTWTTTSGGITQTATGLTNGIKFNRQYSLDKRNCAVVVRLGATSRFMLYTQVSETNSGLATISEVDVAAGQMRIYAAFNGTTLPAVSTSMAYTFLTDRDYKIELGLDKNQFKHILKVTDMKTGLSATLEDTTKNAGRQHDLYSMTVYSGDFVTVKQFAVTTPYKQGLYISHLGDSISEAMGNSVTEVNGFAQQMIKALGNDGSVSGRGSGNITGVIARIDNEVRYMKPKYVSVMIGTNGGNTLTNLQQLVDKIVSYGAIPVIHNIPWKNTSLSTTVNPDIATIRATNNIQGAQMDVATSVNYDNAAQDTSLYYGDVVHPNAAGNLSMTYRVFADVKFKQGVGTATLSISDIAGLQANLDNKITQGGNSFGAPVSIGSNDAQPVYFEYNNGIIGILSSGGFGVGDNNAFRNASNAGRFSLSVGSSTTPATLSRGTADNIGGLRFKPTHASNTGDFFYNETFAGTLVSGARTTGQFYQNVAPSNANDLVRLTDLQYTMPSYTAVTTTYTTAAVRTITANGTFTITLATSGIPDGMEYCIKNIGAGTITISGTIDGVSGATILAGQVLIVRKTGSAYIKIN